MKKVSRRRLVKKTPQPTSPLPSRLTLQTIRIIESHSQLDVFDGVIPDKYVTNIQSGIGVHPAENTLVINTKVTVTSPNDGTGKPQSSIVIMVVAQCLFTLDAPVDLTSCPDEEVKATQQMGLFISWPYVRHHVQTSTGSMSIPPITLPLLRIQPPPQLEAVKQE